MLLQRPDSYVPKSRPDGKCKRTQQTSFSWEDEVKFVQFQAKETTDIVFTRRENNKLSLTFVCVCAFE